MTALLLLPAGLSLLVLAAHFLRAGLLPLVVLALALLPLLALRRPWAARATQLVLLLGTLEWLRTLIAVARVRMALGAPWTRMALILGAMALVAVIAALSFETRRLRERYRQGT